MGPEERMYLVKELRHEARVFGWVAYSIGLVVGFAVATLIFAQ
jgi:hypothetical protein